MQYNYTLTTTIPASAREIYESWLDSLAHSEMTGSEASMSDKIGADVAAWDGYITGRNLELVPGERIVQSWRTAEFTEEHEDSIITVTLEEADDGTLLTLVHTNVPADQTSYEQGGWEEHYFEPMKKYFAARQQEEALAEAPESAAPRRKAAAPKKKAVAKSKSKPKRAAARVKAKPAKKAKKKAKAAKAKGTKAKAGKKKARTAAKAKSVKKAKSAKKAKRRTAKSKRRR